MVLTTGVVGLRVVTFMVLSLVLRRALGEPASPCPSRTARVVDTTNTSVYYDCSNGYLVQLVCPAGLAFLPHVQACVAPETSATPLEEPPSTAATHGLLSSHFNSAREVPAVLADTTAESYNSRVQKPAEPIVSRASISANPDTFVMPRSSISTSSSEAYFLEPKSSDSSNKVQNASRQSISWTSPSSYTEYLNEAINTVPTKSSDELYAASSTLSSLNSKIVGFGTSPQDSPSSYTAVTDLHSTQVESYADSQGHLNTYSSESIHQPTTERLALLTGDAQKEVSLKTLSHDKNGFSPHHRNVPEITTNAHVQEKSDENVQQVSGPIEADGWNHTSLTSDVRYIHHTEFQPDSNNTSVSYVGKTNITKSDSATISDSYPPITTQSTIISAELSGHEEKYRQVLQPEINAHNNSNIPRISPSVISRNITHISTNTQTQISSVLSAKSTSIHPDYSPDSSTDFPSQSSPDITSPCDQCLVNITNKKAQFTSVLPVLPINVPKNLPTGVYTSLNTRSPLQAAVEPTKSFQNNDQDSYNLSSTQSSLVSRVMSVTPPSNNIFIGPANKHSQIGSVLPYNPATIPPHQYADVPINQQTRRASTLLEYVTKGSKFLPKLNYSAFSLQPVKFHSSQYGMNPATLITQTSLDSQFQLPTPRSLSLNISLKFNIDSSTFSPTQLLSFHNDSSTSFAELSGNVPDFSNSSTEMSLDQLVDSHKHVYSQNRTEITAQSMITIPSEYRLGLVNEPINHSKYLSLYSTTTYPASGSITVNTSSHNSSDLFADEDEAALKQSANGPIKSTTAHPQDFVLKTDIYKFEKSNQSDVSSVFPPPQSRVNWTHQFATAVPSDIITASINSQSHTRQDVFNNFTANKTIDRGETVTEASLENPKNNSLEFYSSLHVDSLPSQNESDHSLNSFPTRTSLPDSSQYTARFRVSSELQNLHTIFFTNVSGNFKRDFKVENEKTLQGTNSVNATREAHGTLFDKFSDSTSDQLKNNFAEKNLTNSVSAAFVLQPKNLTSASGTGNYSAERLQYSLRYKTTSSSVIDIILPSTVSITSKYSAHSVSVGHLSNPMSSTAHTEQLPRPPSHSNPGSENEFSPATERPNTSFVFTSTVIHENITEQPVVRNPSQNNASLKFVTSKPPTYSQISSSILHDNNSSNGPKQSRNYVPNYETVDFKFFGNFTTQNPAKLLTTTPVPFSRPLTKPEMNKVFLVESHRPEDYTDVRKQTNPSLKINGGKPPLATVATIQDVTVTSQYADSPPFGFLQNIVNSIIRNLGVLRNVLSTENNLLIPSKPIRRRYDSFHPNHLVDPGKADGNFEPKTSRENLAASSRAVTPEAVKKPEASQISFESVQPKSINYYSKQKTISTKNIFETDETRQTSGTEGKSDKESENPKKHKNQPKRKGTRKENGKFYDPMIPSEEMPTEIVKFEEQANIREESESSEESEDSNSNVAKHKKSMQFLTQKRNMKRSSGESDYSSEISGSSDYKQRTGDKLYMTLKSYSGLESSDESKDSSEDSDSSD